MKILDGKWVRDLILAELKPRVEAVAAKGRPPGLAVVLVGADAASEIYVRNKVTACNDLGIFSEKINAPEDTSTGQLLDIIDRLNGRPDIDGILVQMPVPKQIDEHRILLAIAPEKDVDGFHPYNAGNLMSGNPGPRACTPSGVMEILRRHDIPVRGKKAVVVGRSDIVGKPMAMLLLHADATVTICHSRTVNLEEECRQADILVAALGKPAFIRGSFIKPGATVIDIGINRLNDRASAEAVYGKSPAKMAQFEKNGVILVGDVHPLELDHVGAFTPVPGGVGPLTIAMLMANTVTSAEKRCCA